MALGPSGRKRQHALNVLILGGTRFSGAPSQSLLERGHAVTRFHRGRSLPDGLPGAASVIGDRTVESVAGVEPNFVWVPDEWLPAQGIGPWMEMPLWIPAGEDTVLNSLDCRRAIARGLTFRPLAETVRDTLAWDRTRSRDAQLKAGLDAERECCLLETWNARTL